MTFAEFLAASPSSYHAVDAMAAAFEAAGFVRQCEADAWDWSPGGHYVIRDGAAIAYRLPSSLGATPSFRVVGAHTDSPGFKLKPHPRHQSCGFAQAGMEVYGGPLLNSWLDREFGLAGRVALADGSVRLIQTPAWFRIPQLAPHLDRSVNEALRLDPQRQLMPVYALSANGADIVEAIADLVGCRAEEIMGHDLLSFIPQGPELVGLDNQFLASGRLDNLTSVYPGMQAVINAQPEAGVIAVLACFDHEEVGSSTYSGASGSFLDDVLARIAGGLGIVGDEVYQMRARSWVVSSDAGHSVNPNYPEMYDPDERPLMGSGPMLKLNAKQRYASDARGEALWMAVCREAAVPCQWFVSNNAVSCGTTIGPLAATRLGISTVDVGVPILSMHSAREMCCVADVDALEKAFTRFYSR